MPGSPDPERPLDRKKIEQAFGELSERLRAMEVRAHLYVIGGAAMLMAHRRSETTMDVDALEIDPRDTVLAAAKEVGRELSLTTDWLNDKALTVGAIVGRPDETREVLYNSPNLVVTGASARHMLAMKVRACRRDESDITLLIRKLGIRKMSEVEEIHRAVYPKDEISPRKAARIQDLLLEEAIRHRHAALRRHEPGRDYGPER